MKATVWHPGNTPSPTTGSLHYWESHTYLKSSYVTWCFFFLWCCTKAAIHKCGIQTCLVLYPWAVQTTAVPHKSNHTSVSMNPLIHIHTTLPTLDQGRPAESTDHTLQPEKFLRIWVSSLWGGGIGRIFPKMYPVEFAL